MEVMSVFRPNGTSMKTTAARRQVTPDDPRGAVSSFLQLQSHEAGA